MINRRLVNIVKIGLIAFLLLATLLGILMFTKIAVASGSGRTKYYTSICVEEGDTLWDISESNRVDGVTTNEYLNELCSINNIEKHANLRAGDYLTIYYFK